MTSMPLRPNALIGLCLVAVLVLACLLGLVWTPYDPIAIDLAHPFHTPNGVHWLGTDQFGRDILSRALLGARISVMMAVSVVAIDVVLGLALGVATGFLRGWTDRVLMAASDTILAFPGILLALGLIAVMGGSEMSIIVALSIAYLPSVVRVTRASVLSIREREYIEASKLAGDTIVYTMWRHVLPNALTPVVVLASSLFGWVILSESALSFLGVGVPPPAPTWGNMLADARPYVQTHAWISLIPGLCIALTLLGVNLSGDALREWLDPREDQS